jgi:peptide/nickel transport system ATP-binding protein
LDAATFAQRRSRDLSGGQRQRVAVARSIISSPTFIILDEPTSALDASVQAQVLNLLSRIHDELRLTYLFITHNISVARFISDKIAVMYAGKVVETGPTDAVITNPKHPYTQALLRSVPNLETHDIVPPVGEVPSLVNLPNGCRFNPRCPFVMERCKTEEPPLKKMGDLDVACWLY